MFDFDKEFTVTSRSALKDTNRIMCDYLMRVTIEQGVKTYFGELGFIGMDKTTTKPKYLFIENKIYYLDDTTIFSDILPNENKFTRWLFM